MLTQVVLDRLSKRTSNEQEDNSPPRIRVGNALPSGYVIVTAGAGFWYRRNQNQDPETTLQEDLSIETGEYTTLRGTRRDCCRLVQVFLDVEVPSGDVVFVSKTLTAPSGQCIVQESLVLEPSTLSMGSTINMRFEQEPA